MDDIDKAEYTQALQAYLIPSSLFIACLLGAAGTFLIREGYGLGWAFIALFIGIVIWAMLAFVTFQNKLRAKGLMKDQYDSPAPYLEESVAEQANGSTAARTAMGAEPLPADEIESKPLPAAQDFSVPGRAAKELTAPQQN